MKTQVFSLLIFVTFGYVQNLLTVAAAAEVAVGGSKDSEQLLRFKASLPNPTVLPSWVATADPCNFAAVTCKSSRVSSIDLDSVDLATDFHSVASFLLSLDYLESLSLKSTNLAGTIAVPAGFRCGVLLSSLDLSRNNISGGISHLSSCAGLKFLNLSGNRMTGDVDVSSCEKLVHLDISSNNFSATVPKLGSCMDMEFLDFSTNHFHGEIGDALSACSQLAFLNLSVNHFSGAVPPLPTEKLQYVYLSSNAFEGQIPASLADACSTLVELDLSLNQLSGDLPPGLSACTVLQLFDISSNNFSGELPGDVLFSGMPNVKKLVLAFNEFNGQLPESISKLTALETLDLSSNSLSGTIPGGLCSSPANSLKVLYLQNNLFGGPIPPTLSNCSHLVSLDLSFNYLTGTIPASLQSLRELRDMIFLLNQLEGEIPKELMHIQTLENLILDFNFLSGTIPPELSNCTELNWVSLSNNRLNGHIPGWFGQLSNLAILKLSNNSFYGEIPAELGESRSLIWLDLNTNLLSGEIPAALFKHSGSISVKLINDKRYAYIKNDGSRECHGAGNLLEFAGIRPEQLNRISTRNPCNFTRVYKGLINPTFKNNGSMIFLDISYNSLTGSIPKEIGSMYYLNILNLGSNNISGSIPRELGDLRNLNILDLSENQLEGMIPQALAGCTLLSEINLSHNLLTGPIPSMGQLGTFPSSSFFNNSGLCGIPLPPCRKKPSSNESSNPENSGHSAASIIRNVAMGLLLATLCIIGFIFVALDIRKKRMKMKESESVDVYVDGLTNNNTNWKLTTNREALSINLATFEKPLKKLTFADLLDATNGFHPDSLIGSGGFGDVYRAVLKDRTVVAIKKLVQISGQGDREFMAEMETIGKIKHRNLVSLLGYCKVKEERLLVYEFMKNGSLEDILHDGKLGMVLDWPARRKIAIGAARGLAFLHHNCIPHIIHRDMKSSNVLIDENLDSRVSDFGMARLMSALDTHLSVSTLAGTPGYVPPEYYQSFQCTTKGDVYSYGVVLLELITGRRPTDSADFGDNNIVGWVKQKARICINDVIDPRLLEADPRVETELVELLKMAIACLDDRPPKRPTMIQVLASFKENLPGSGLNSSPSAVAAADSEFGVAGMSIEEEDMH